MLPDSSFRTNHFHTARFAPNPWFAFQLVVISVLTCVASLAIAQQEVNVAEEIQDEEKLVEQLGQRNSAIINDGDRLTFLYHSNAKEVQLTNMIGAKLISRGRSGLHMAQVTVPGSERLLMSYAFAENDENGWDKLKHYRGPQAPQIPQSVTPLEGQHFVYQLDSKHLGEKRKVEVYVPNTKSEGPLPVVYLTDGGALESVLGALEWKIRTGTIQPLIVVGVHNGGYVGDRNKRHDMEFDYRAKEYLSGLGDPRYEKHNKFLSEEVFPFVQTKHGASDRREERALSGYSNGGAYALTVATDHPDWFGDIFAYSIAFFDRASLRESVKEKSLPRFRLAAGTLEGFIRGTQDAHDILSEVEASTKIRTYVAGHDPLMWRIALLEDLEARFPGPKQDQK